jgi:lysophospholipase L1-like esterase
MIAVSSVAEQNATYAPAIPGVALQVAQGALRNREQAPFRFAVIGDSVVEGRNASTNPGTRWVDLVRDGLRQAYPTSGIGTGGGVGYLPFFTVSPQTSPWTSTAVTQNFTNGLGLKATQLNGVSSKITGTVTGTSIDILYLSGTSSRLAYYKIDGGAAVNFETGNQGSVSDTGILRVSLGSAGSHTLEFGWVSGTTVYLEGLIVYNGDENKGIHLIEAGHSGYETVQYDDAAQAAGHPARLASLAPQLVILALGENDYLHGFTSASYKTRLKSIITKIRAAYAGAKPSFAILSNYEANASGGNIEPWSNFVQAARDASQEDTLGPYGMSGVQHIDLSIRMPRILGDTQSLYGDNYHPNDKGHRLMAYHIHQAIAPKG